MAPTQILSQLSSDALALIGFLEDAKVGELIPYDAMSKVITRDRHDMKRLRPPLMSARRALMRTKKMVFDCVPGQGLVLLSNSQTAEALPSYIRRAHRATLRGRKVASCVDVVALPQAERAGFVGRVSMLALLGEISTSSATKKLEGAAAASPSQSTPLAAEMAWKALQEGK